MNVQSILFLGGFVIGIATLYALRREHIRAEYSVGWLAAGAVLAAVGLVPAGIETVSSRLGLDAELCSLIAAATLMVGLVLGTTRLAARLWDERVMLAQRVAILEFRLRQDQQRHGVERQ